jgi:adenylate cyclase
MAVRWAWIWSVTRKHLAGLLAGLAVLVLVQFALLDGLEYWSLATLFEWRGPRPAAAPIVIVTVDESTFAELNLQWPFPRAVHGELIARIAAGRPLAIGVDLIFDTPSLRGPEDDEALGAAVAAAGNVVLGAAVAEDLQVVPGLDMVYERATLNQPIEVIRRGAAAVAPVNMLREQGGQIRKAVVRMPMADEWLLGFDAQLHALVARAGLSVAPLPTTPTVLINFRGGPNTYPWISYYQVIRGEVPSTVFADKIVLIGPTSEILHDQFPTAFARGGDMPGVEVHANALETLIRGNPIREVPRGVSTALAMATALLGAVLVVRLHAFRALVAAVGVWAVLVVAAYAGFALLDAWIRGMAGSIGLVLGYGATVLEHFVREQRERRRLSQFFSPDVVREVVRHKDEGSLTTSRRLVTVLFSDLRGFTSISEKLEPEQVAEMLREYLSEMTEIVFKHGGTVDKYIGDCIMALYNVPFEDPEHAVKAVRTGLEFQERTIAVSQRWEAKLGVALRNGVGINTGEAVVGTLGSRQRLEYTAIGDTINLGSRLESITKEYKTNIIISESTYEHVKDHFVTKELGDVTVKGKTRPVKIYAVLPDSIRKHPRATLEAAATLSVAGEGRACQVTTRDIGEGGMALKGVPADWRVGQRVQVRCAGGALPKPIVADASIAWRRGDEVGVVFTALDADSAPAVADYVSRHGKR